MNLSESSPLCWIDQVLREEDAFIVYLHKAGGFVVAVLDRDHAQRDVATDGSFWGAVSAGVERRFQELALGSLEPAIKPDEAVLNDLPSRIVPGSSGFPGWIEATRDQGRIAVTLHTYYREPSWRFIRDPYGLFSEITGAVRVYGRREAIRRGYGDTFWMACKDSLGAG